MSVVPSSHAWSRACRRSVRIGALGCLILGLGAPAESAAAATVEEMRARTLLASKSYQGAVASFDREFERFIEEMILLTEIPAPPFGERPRAEAYARLLREAGLEQVEIDAEGNAIGLWRGKGGAPMLAVSAHLDTVFAPETDLKVKRVGTTLRGPGIGDDARGLAFLLAAARAMQAGTVETAGDILFVGTVGEEGLGDLRGVKHLFLHGRWKDRIKRFITVDGRSNDMVVNGALGSIRYKVTFKGPGGHSWAGFGQVNPAFAMADAIVKLGKLVVPKQPKVSYNVGMLSGGTSVNSIPFEVAMEVDLRSTSPVELRKLEAEFKRLVDEAVADENATRGTMFGRITAEVTLIGNRPSGVTSPDTPELKQAVATMRALGKIAVFEMNSTDANLPISLGLPAFAIASQSAERGGRAHTLEEWTDVEQPAAVRDFALALAVILSVANTP